MNSKVKEFMTRNPVIVSTDTTLKEAAQQMKSVDCGVLPVGTWENPQGMITDRDIVTRAVAQGVDVTSAKVGDFMTSEVFYCNETDSLAQAADQMRQCNVGRLLVKDSNGVACGIITFGCMMREEDSLKEIGEVVECAIGKKAA